MIVQDTPIASDEGTLPLTLEVILYGMTEEVGLPVGGFVAPSVGVVVGGTVGAAVGIAPGPVVGGIVGVVDTGATVSETFADVVGEAAGESGAVEGDIAAAMEHVHFPTGKTSVPSGPIKTPSSGNPRVCAVSPSARIRVMFRCGSVGVLSDL